MSLVNVSFRDEDGAPVWAVEAAHNKTITLVYSQEYSRFLLDRFPTLRGADITDVLFFWDGNDARGVPKTKKIEPAQAFQPLSSFLSPPSAAADAPPTNNVTFILKPPATAPVAGGSVVPAGAAVVDAANRDFDLPSCAPSTLGAAYTAGELTDRVKFFDNGFPDQYADGHLPPEVLFAEFSQFMEDCESCTPTIKEHAIVTELVQLISRRNYSSENAKTSKLSTTFNALLSKGGPILQDGRVEQSDAATDGITKDIKTGMDHRIDHIFVVMENTLGFGSTKSDPIIQSLGHYQEAICSVPKGQRADLLPCLNIVCVGPFLMVGAMYAAYDKASGKSRSVWYPLTPMYPCTIYYERPHYMSQLARVIIAARNCIQNLQKYYEGTVARSNWAMPQDVSVTTLPDAGDASGVHEVLPVEVVDRLRPQKLLFRGFLAGKPVLIKFATTYGIAAHKAAAAAGLAPALYAIGKRGPFTVVVMEELRAYRRFTNVVTHNAAIATAVVEAYKALAAIGIVHGDLHPANILIDDTDGEHPQVKFVDFDWAAVNDEVKRYPGFINPALVWHDGVQPGAELSQQHDEFLVNHLTTPENDDVRAQTSSPNKDPPHEVAVAVSERRRGCGTSKAKPLHAAHVAHNTDDELSFEELSSSNLKRSLRIAALAMQVVEKSQRRGDVNRPLVGSKRKRESP